MIFHMLSLVSNVIMSVITMVTLVWLVNINIMVLVVGIFTRDIITMFTIDEKIGLPKNESCITNVTLERKFRVFFMFMTF